MKSLMVIFDMKSLMVTRGCKVGKYFLVIANSRVLYWMKTTLLKYPAAFRNYLEDICFWFLHRFKMTTAQLGFLKASLVLANYVQMCTIFFSIPSKLGATWNKQQFFIVSFCISRRQQVILKRYVGRWGYREIQLQVDSCALWSF